MVGGGAEAVIGVKRAMDLGFKVIVSDGSAACPAAAVADRFVLCDTYDAAQTAAAVHEVMRRERVDGIMAMCADVPLTVAHAARFNGLPGIPPEVAELGTSKVLMKQALLDHGIPTARGWQVHGAADVARCVPCVVKPVDSRGARGVTILPSPGWTPGDAYEAARQASPRHAVVCEELLQGPQVSTETLLLDGGAVTFVLDRNYARLAEFAPYVVEDGAHGPSALPEARVRALISLAERAARSVLNHWAKSPCPVTVKGDLVWTDDGPKVIELALRLSGGYMSTTLLPLMTGVDVIGTAVRLALGEAVSVDEARITQQRGVAIRYDIPPGCRSHPERRGHAISVGMTALQAIADAANALHKAGGTV